MRRFCVRITDRLSGPFFFGFREEDKNLCLDNYALATKEQPTSRELETLKFFIKIGAIEEETAVKLKFYNKIREIDHRIIGKYTNSTTPVKCVCPLGYIVEITPKYIKSYRKIYLNTSCSYGEKMTFGVLKKNFSDITVQASHPNIKRLRFDFKFIYKDKTIYIEYDGEQHQKEVPYFHVCEHDFARSRQRDLVKNYVCLHSPNTMLIRLDHTWINEKRSDEELEQYVLDAINSDQKIVADPEIYNWINDVPSEETLQKYIIGDFHPFIINFNKSVRKRRIKIIVNE